MTESLSVYWGGLFGNGCLPLEMSLNWCSSGCSYCFANLNSPNREANVTQIMGMLSKYQEKETFAAQLLRMGYPVVASNHVDFFADSNAQVSLPILETMTELGIPFSLQTKCGKKGYAYDALKFINKTVFYISIATDQEDHLARIEPGAPTAKERFRFIEAAIAQGHRVVVGINPCVPDWLDHPDNPTRLCKTLAKIGVEGVWVQPLHLSNNQIGNMSDRERASLGEAVLNRGRKFRKDPESRTMYLKTREAAQLCGMEVYDGQQRERSDYFRPYRETYQATFPTIQDFVNYCYDSGKGENDPIYFEEWRDFFLPSFPEGVFPLRNHIGAVQYQQFWKGDRGKSIPQHMTYETLLEIIWSDHDIIYHPCHVNCFAIAGDRTGGEDDKFTLYLDDNERYILLFRPNGCGDRAAQWEMW